MAKQCLNQCCFCLTLEMGGYIIGWLYIIGGSLASIGSIALGITFANFLSSGDPEIDEAIYKALLILFSIYAAIALIYVVAGILLILGIKKKEHRKILMMLIMMGIGVGASFLNLTFSAGNYFITTSIIGAIIQVYFFVCIYSLYAKIKNEIIGKTYG
ncbi:hypothetical protein PVAND_005822 [Polypedilum vanderplanki]|uniref:Uncharacterized protein n=1 Tax=Polypedilum vanderplanki TaxID=319348 RepID=A0A9J6C371_POLVA|nr:hypothetical protein PVAND_005822 [Polypedilum vanderplanki]